MLFHQLFLNIVMDKNGKVCSTSNSIKSTRNVALNGRFLVLITMANTYLGKRGCIIGSVAIDKS